MVDLKGKAALVTGGAQGIGKAVCQAILNKGVKVCIVDVDEAAGQDTLKELQNQYGDKNVMFKKCDVSAEQEFKAAVLEAKATYGHLDILINNAGICREDDWLKTILINLHGVMIGTMLAFEHLADDKGKKDGTMIINTASIAGRDPLPMTPAYTTSKHGVVGWTACWGHEANVKNTGIKVNGVCPYPVDTALYRSAKGTDIPIQAEEFKKKSDKWLLKSSTVAEAYVQLLEEDCSGKLLVVSPDKGIYPLPYTYL